jgi:Leucine Rich repeat
MRKPAWRIGFRPAPFLVALVVLWAGCHGSSSPNTFPTPVKNADNKEMLTLTGGNYSREQYAQIKAYEKTLQILQMANPVVTDAYVDDLKGMQVLEELDLGSSKVTDDSMAILAGLPKLHSLRLNGTPITDKGLQTLASGKSLVFVDARNTSVTPGGSLKWQQSQPGRIIKPSPPSPE